MTLQPALRRTASSMPAKRNRIRVIGYLFTTLRRPDVISQQHWRVINKNFVNRGITGDYLYSRRRKSAKGKGAWNHIKKWILSLYNKDLSANGLKLEMKKLEIRHCSAGTCSAFNGNKSPLRRAVILIQPSRDALCGASSPPAAADARLTSRCPSKTAHNMDSPLTSTQRPARRPKYMTTEHFWANWWGVKIPQIINYHSISDLSESSEEYNYCGYLMKKQTNIRIEQQLCFFSFWSEMLSLFLTSQT